MRLHIYYLLVISQELNRVPTHQLKPSDISDSVYSQGWLKDYHLKNIFLNKN